MTEPSVQPGSDRSELGPRLVRVLVVAGVVVGGYLFLASVLPRWWSHRIGAQVDGDLTTGALLGFVYGFACTLLPLLVLAAVWRFRRRSVWAWVVGAGLAVLVAAPNLVLLGIAIGNGGAAHAADRTLDVEAPWFRGGTVIGVVAALGIAGLLVWTVASRSRARRHAREARNELAADRGAREVQQPPEP